MTTDFWRAQFASLICLVSITLSLAVGYFVFRPLSWRQFLDRYPLFLVTGGAFLMMAIGDLPDAVPRLFEGALGHPIYQMVYEQEGSGITYGELWINRWEERAGAVFRYLLLVAAVWAIVNLSRKHALRANALALVVLFGWVCALLWAMSTNVLF
jgi:hypothetical protein